MGYNWDYQGMAGGWWVLMMIGMIVFWSILVFGVVALVRHNHSGPTTFVHPENSDKAVAILRERLARSEITPEEFTTLLATLRDRS
ncbi:MAG: SHOCT domain-containing protein [Acidimicrobiales bacterium]